MSALTLGRGTAPVLNSVNVFERCQDFHHRLGIARIIDGLRIAAGPDQLLGAKLGEMLRQGRLAKANLRREDADGNYTLHEAHEDEQALGVCHC
jgi:hypothetical protein